MHLVTKATTGLVSISYREALLRTLLQPLHTFAHNLLNVLVQITNKMGLQKILSLSLLPYNVSAALQHLWYYRLFSIEFVSAAV
jgi:hypothetical protein